MLVSSLNPWKWSQNVGGHHCPGLFDDKLSHQSWRDSLINLTGFTHFTFPDICCRTPVTTGQIIVCLDSYISLLCPQVARLWWVMSPPHYCFAFLIRRDQLPLIQIANQGRNNGVGSEIVQLAFLYPPGREFFGIVGDGKKAAEVPRWSGVLNRVDLFQSILKHPREGVRNMMSTPLPVDDIITVFQKRQGPSC